MTLRPSAYQAASELPPRTLRVDDVDMAALWNVRRAQAALDTNPVPASRVIFVRQRGEFVRAPRDGLKPDLC